MLNNILLTAGCATVFIGTLYPLALKSLTGAKISVGPPYFNLTFVPLMVPLLLALPLGPFSPGSAATCPARRSGCWRRRSLVARRRRSLALTWRGPWLAPFGIALGVWSLPARSPSWPRACKLLGAGRDEAWRRARGLPRSAYGGTWRIPALA